MVSLCKTQYKCRVSCSRTWNWVLLRFLAREKFISLHEIELWLLFYSSFRGVFPLLWRHFIRFLLLHKWESLGILNRVSKRMYFFNISIYFKIDYKHFTLNPNEREREREKRSCLIFQSKLSLTPEYLKFIETSRTLFTKRKKRNNRRSGKSTSKYSNLYRRIADACWRNTNFKWHIYFKDFLW